MHFAVKYVCHQLTPDLLFCHKQSRKKIVPGCTTHEKSHFELPVCFCRKNTMSLEKRPKHRNLHTCQVSRGPLMLPYWTHFRKFLQASLDEYFEIDLSPMVHNSQTRSQTRLLLKHRKVFLLFLVCVDNSMVQSPACLYCF